jgi:hypothetical protein
VPGRDTVTHDDRLEYSKQTGRREHKKAHTHDEPEHVNESVGGSIYLAEDQKWAAGGGDILPRCMPLLRRDLWEYLKRLHQWKFLPALRFDEPVLNVKAIYMIRMSLNYVTRNGKNCTPDG